MELKNYKIKVGNALIRVQKDIGDHAYDYLFEELGLFEVIDDLK